MERFIEQCCDQCTHSPQNSCRDFVECCMDGPLCHNSEPCREKRKQLVERVALNDKFVIS